ncbi:hypothetical protein ACFL2Z_01070 [Candidatus Eisenbacteria bacterium]|uniref:Nucleotidyltransferase n=1 Tax=Eiseniibacteriota bacterium TaxID=2212470 RepID=A0ABV6YN37_UNCEI
MREVIRVLGSLGIDYMISGSLVSSLQGEPRSTHDIDIVIDMTRPAVKSLAAAFPQPEYYLSEESILGAIGSDGMFNLIVVATGDKVDFWVLTGQPFDISRFARKRVESVMGMEIPVSSPEDTILMKLRWAQESGGSEKHFTDALRVYEVQYKELDTDYMEKWANELEIVTMYTKMREDAEVL